jgi:hypothetical protein
MVGRKRWTPMMQNTKQKLDIYTKEPFVRLQNLCDNDLYVWWKLSQ